MNAHLTRAVSGACLLSLSTWINAATLATSYSIDIVGLIDAEHTRGTDNYRSSSFTAFNESGQIVGTARRYDSSGALLGQSAWLYKLGATVNIGLTDSEHTASNGYRSSFTSAINAAGQVTGTSQRYDSNGTDIGTSSWFYNGSNTALIGLNDAEHTRSSDTARYNFSQFLNANGQVAGYSYRYNNAGNDNGQSAWLYSNGQTTVIGLVDPEHTGTDDYQNSRLEYFNDAGQAVGSADLFRSDGTANGQSTWIYSGGATVNIGPADSEHTGANDYRYSQVQLFNASGQAVGSAYRYRPNGTYIGQSAWLYSNGSTIKIGLTDSTHTDTDGYQHNYARNLNNSGQVVGVAQRYSTTGDAIGQSAWLYNNDTTINIGLRDNEHTSAAGTQYSDVQYLNNAGQAVGRAVRFNNAAAGSFGMSTWLYSNGNTIKIGLTDAEHTRSTDGYRNSSLRLLNESGQVIGSADRFDSSGAANGQSAWLYRDGNTINVGLADARHTGTNERRDGTATYLNEAGQVAGYSYSYTSTGIIAGQTAWFYDPGLDQTLGLDLSIRADGASYSRINYLGDDGLALGYYQLFDTNDALLGYRAFAFTLEDGAVDLGQLLNDELTSAGWDYLANAYRANPGGQILGYGLLADMTTGQVGFLLTPQVSAVPLPGAAWLFSTGLVGLIAVVKGTKTDPRSPARNA